MKTLLKFGLAAIWLVIGFYTAQAQSTKQQKKADEIKTLINSVNYVFKADYVTPRSGTGRALTGEYDLRITKDTVISFLPYFGRAYVAPINPYSSDGQGIKFTSTQFDYTVKEGKKSDWDISIKPKGGNISDMRDVQQLKLSVSSNGYATLYVTSTNRDPISFNGTIEAAEKK